MTVSNAEKALGTTSIPYSGTDVRWNILFATTQSSGFRVKYVFARQEGGVVSDYVVEYK